MTSKGVERLGHYRDIEPMIPYLNFKDAMTQAGSRPGNDKLC
jgi:hypothetical protein